MILPWILCCFIFLINIILIIKIRHMQKSVCAISKSFGNIIDGDTNSLITTASDDFHIRHLASEINRQISHLREMQLRYINGDRMLKDNIMNLAHDLRTPLTAILGYVDLLETTSMPYDSVRYIEQIKTQALAICKLSEELFNYSVVTATVNVKSEQINITRILEETIISFYGVMHQKRIVPDIRITSDPIYRNIDSDLLSRVFSNIIENMLKYSDGDFLIKTDEHGIITFENTAANLTNVDAGKLFDKFYTVNTAKKSTGLGLSIAKQLVEKMNGKISAQYHEGRLSIKVIFEK